MHERLAASGFSLVELLIVMVLAGALAAMALPVFVHASDAAEATAAARHIAALVARARFEAARRNRTVAIRFDGSGADAMFTIVADGDGDGVSDEDIAAGVDAAIRPADRLSHHFKGARFAVAGAIAGIDGGAALTAADDPIRLGPARQLSLSPIGTASSGTVYIASGRGVQLAVRIAGVTGRVRVLRYVPGDERWVPA
jgi:prepilin-type N-terminal cleavage/methylation domain-containing protein